MVVIWRAEYDFGINFAKLCIWMPKFTKKKKRLFEWCISMIFWWVSYVKPAPKITPIPPNSAPKMPYKGNWWLWGFHIYIPHIQVDFCIYTNMVTSQASRFPVSVPVPLDIKSTLQRWFCGSFRKIEQKMHRFWWKYIYGGNLTSWIWFRY